MSLSIFDLLIRIGFAVLSGGLIGIDRGRKLRPAGFRTYMIVCVGAAMTMILGQYLYITSQTLFFEEGTEVSVDVARIGAQVINGIGFLGAGTIIVTGRQEVKGMTTAAGLWASACMGLCIGAGFYIASALCCALIIFTIVIFSHLERLILSHSRNINLFIEFEDTDDLARIIEKIKENDTRIFDVEITKAKYSENHYPNAVFSLELPKKKPHALLLSSISEIDSVRVIEEL